MLLVRWELKVRFHEIWQSVIHIIKQNEREFKCTALIEKIGLAINTIRQIKSAIHHFCYSIHHFSTSIRHFRHSIRQTRSPHPTTKKLTAIRSELSLNLLILIFCFEGTFHLAFGFFFAHVAALVVVFFPFTDAN